jgi:predicted O-methyltransferase YrrM
MRYDITNIAIEDYLADLMPPRIEPLAALEEKAREQGLSLVGAVQGQFLYLLARSMEARQVLEVGITTGYAAMWLLQALSATGGYLTGIERQPERCQLARGVLSRAGLGDKATIHEGEWYNILPTLSGPYDLIFLDILRSVSNVDQATQALEMCIPLLRTGGMLVADNVLCSAQVLEDEEDAPPLVRGIQLFNKAVMSHPQLESVIIPLRDGVAISRKRDT